jgi:hypothetical protein
VPEMIPGEINVFARVENVNGSRMSQNINVAKGGRKVSLGGVEAEEILYPALLEPSPETDEERRFLVFSAFEVFAKQREQVPKDRSLSR